MKRTGFWDTEVGEDQASNTSRTPDEEHLHTEISISWAVIDEVWGWKMSVNKTSQYRIFDKLTGITDTEVP